MRNKLDAWVWSVCLSLAVISRHIIKPQFDSDILWSIAVGKWIMFKHTFPITDSFSWTINGKEWMTHEWLYCVSAYQMHQTFGSFGLYILGLLPILLTIYVLYLIGAKQDQNGSYSYLLVMTLGIVFLYALATPFRAYIYSLLFFTILLYLLYFKEQSPWDSLYYLILFSLWANIQVSVFIGLSILCFEMVRQAILDKSITKVLLIALAGMATLINPYGYKIWVYFYKMLINMGGAKTIIEWRAPDFNNLVDFSIYLVLASSIVILQFVAAKHSRPGPGNILDPSGESNTVKNTGENIFFRGYHTLYKFLNRYLTSSSSLILLFWAFYVYSLRSARMIYFAIVLWIIVTSYFTGILGNLNFTKRTYKILTLVFGIYFVLNLAVANLKIQDITVCDPKISPVEEVDFLKENPNFQKHLFNEYLYGGYLILNDIPVFIDARSDSYIEFGIQSKYVGISTLSEEPQEILDELGVENILIQNDCLLDRYLAVNRSWVRLNRGAYASIYTRSVL